MRCRKHHSDLSSTVGVCASCLRERLFTLIAAQAQAQAQQQQQAQLCNHSAADPLPPPLVFPRSVSPYVSRRKSDETAWSDVDRSGRRNRLLDSRFYSTPQIGPTYGTSSSAASTFVSSGSFGKKPKSRFSLWSSLFRSRSDKFEKNHRNPSREISEPAPSSSSSPSWFSIFSTRRHKQSSRVTLDEQAAAAAAERRIERGMSPARMSESDEECVYSNRSPSAAPGSAKRGRGGHKRNVSGFAFCLSPLVRASPNRSWNQKGLPPEIAFSGDLRKPHLAANRSRKIADFGRVNHNR